MCGYCLRRDITYCLAFVFISAKKSKNCYFQRREIKVKVAVSAAVYSIICSLICMIPLVYSNQKASMYLASLQYLHVF